MIDTVYVEEEVIDHPRVRDVRKRFPSAAWVPVNRYTEVFNRNAQSFRLQKKRPALLLARKHDRHVLSAPPGYGIGGDRNFYFSPMLNCVYDCRYCFLQGMYRSAHYVLFVNYEDFEDAIVRELDAAPGAELYFFSGYDADSLALEPVSRFAESFIPFFEKHPRAWFELRSKSTLVDALLARRAIANAVVAWSFTPAHASKALEHGVPPVSRRAAVMGRLAREGWKLGLRFDPLIYDERFKEAYGQLFAEVLGSLPMESIHSVSLGAFRMPDEYFRTVARLYPEEPLFAGPLESRDRMVTYRREVEEEMTAWARREILEYVPPNVFFPCRA